MYENRSYQGVLGLTFGNSAYLFANDQFDANQFYITATTNQKRDVFSHDGEIWGSKSSLRSVSLGFTSGSCFRGSVFVSSNPPVPLLIGRRGAASLRVVTIGRLVVKCCSSLIPTVDSVFKVELARLIRKINEALCIYFKPINASILGYFLKYYIKCDSIEILINQQSTDR